MKWEVTVPIVISALSLVLSVFAIIISHRQNKKISIINLKAEYYHIIFNEYIIKRIPKAYKMLRFDNNKLTDFDTISNVCTDMLNDILYFKFINEEFYDSLKDAIQELEDYILISGNKKYEPEEQWEVFEEIIKRINRLYTIIDNSYIGERKRFTN